MPQWNPPPPTDNRSVPFRLVRVPAKAPLTGIITALEPLGCYTHFAKRRTLPCDGEERCEYCAEGFSRRWHCYVSLLLAQSLEHVILELTAAGSDPLRNYYRLHDTIRECRMSAVRPSGRPNGRVIVTCKPPQHSMTRIPDPPDVRRILCHLWGIQYRNDEPITIDRARMAARIGRPSDDDGNNGREHPDPDA